LARGALAVGGKRQCVHGDSQFVGVGKEGFTGHRFYNDMFKIRRIPERFTATMGAVLAGIYR
jgi:hypothetical protein